MLLQNKKEILYSNAPEAPESPLSTLPDAVQEAWMKVFEEFGLTPQQLDILMQENRELFELLERSVKTALESSMTMQTVQPHRNRATTERNTNTFATTVAEVHERSDW